MSTGSPTDSASVLSEVVRAAEPSLRAHARSDLPRARYVDRFPGDPDRAFVVEAVLEGYLLHYGTPRLFAGMDEDLRLLGGDALYALGLSRLAELGDLPGVAELADLISLCSRVAAEGRSELAERLWEGSVARLAGEAEGGASAAFAANA